MFFLQIDHPSVTGSDVGEIGGVLVFWFLVFPKNTKNLKLKHLQFHRHLTLNEGETDELYVSCVGLKMFRVLVWKLIVKPMELNRFRDFVSDTLLKMWITPELMIRKRHSQGEKCSNAQKLVILMASTTRKYSKNTFFSKNSMICFGSFWFCSGKPLKKHTQIGKQPFPFWKYFF